MYYSACWKGWMQINVIHSISVFNQAACVPLQKIKYLLWLIGRKVNTFQWSDLRPKYSHVMNAASCKQESDKQANKHVSPPWMSWNCIPACFFAKLKYPQERARDHGPQYSNECGTSPYNFHSVMNKTSIYLSSEELSCWIRPESCFSRVCWGNVQKSGSSSMLQYPAPSGNVFWCLRSWF